MLTPSQAKRIEVFARHVTIAEAPVRETTPALAQQLLKEMGEGREIKQEWAYALFIEIGDSPATAQGYGATVMTSERSMAALSEAIARFWEQLWSEGVFNGTPNRTEPVPA